ncbi:FAD/FMN-containing dehydrogenase [Elysia marginata]|uniref:FAD/FMN-containing dehydrogenase n=1 Tax=Elysia marginata TaxID=1093978 RepID=A0AAV4FT20_9GAST|nr:FAD/FMN-containing dehydrogenase [Elysia marginata]
MLNPDKFSGLETQIEGDLLFDKLHRTIYATDASVYRELPLAVAYPKKKEDVQTLILFAKAHKTSLIPRSGGTSIAGQCVGKGIVVDVSRYMNNILEVDTKNKTVCVEPGVIRDELNRYIKPHNLFFSPNTSTSNRCTIGGMVGNNSSGTTSIKYGVTRDKVLEIEAILSNGNTVVFKALSPKELEAKIIQKNLEGTIYKTLVETLSKKNVITEIEARYPKPQIHRRNTGYALDSLLEMEPLQKDSNKPFNLCKFLSGSEGTLVFITKIKLQLDDLPPPHRVTVCAHFDSVADCCASVKMITERHDLYACEMMDKVILDCTKNNKVQTRNRSFVKGDPKAILMLELRSDDKNDLENQKNDLLKTIESQNLSYENALLYGGDVNKAEELRKAGLGLLGNMKGDRKGVACIEDTAVALEDFSEYISRFEKIMEKHQQKSVFFAHAGAGELHLRPLLNLKKQEDVALFREITTEVAELVRSFNGSMSGEHGDGRVRSEFLEMMVGKTVYNAFKNIKKTFDPSNIFNSGKIVNVPPMDEDLRYQPDRREPRIKTLMDFSDTLGILRAVEQCNGSGDCRKTHLSQGMMCPSYQATKNEKDTTRARANALREFLTHSPKYNKFDHKELKDVLDLCVACKACKGECPSNVDITALKTEFLYQYKKANGYSLQDKVFAFNHSINKMVAKFPKANVFLKNKHTASLAKRILKIAPSRTLPTVKKFNIRDVCKTSSKTKGKVLLFLDEFSTYTDSDIVKDAFDLLLGLGYDVDYFMGDSGRGMLSVGYLKHAKQLAEKNCDIVSQEKWKDLPILGIEPSAILSFRDEYLRLVQDKKRANQVKERAFLIEEFLSKDMARGVIEKEAFHSEKKDIKIHIHCHQKSLSNQKVTFDILNFPKNYSATLMNTGCCGMAGGFGYHKEHYQTSIGIANLSLFPKIKNASLDTIIVANGTSCRQQICDGTERTALHPVSILRQALV